MICQNYNLSNRAIARVLLMSMCLQSCLNSSVPRVDIEEKHQNFSTSTSSPLANNIKEIQADSRQQQELLDGFTTTTTITTSVATDDRMLTTAESKPAGDHSQGNITPFMKASSRPVSRDSAQGSIIQKGVAKNKSQGKPTRKITPGMVSIPAEKVLDQRLMYKFKHQQGQVVKIYHEQGRYIAIVDEQIGVFTKKHILPVYEFDMCLEELVSLSEFDQKNYLHVTLPRTSMQQIGGVYIGRKGVVGGVGGGSDGEKKSGEKEGKEKEGKEFKPLALREFAFNRSLEVLASKSPEEVDNILNKIKSDYSKADFPVELADKLKQKLFLEKSKTEIFKILDDYIKTTGAKYFVGKKKCLKTIFKEQGVTFESPVARLLVTNNKKRLYLNSAHKSISICDEVGLMSDSGKINTNLDTVIDQIIRWNTKFESTDKKDKKDKGNKKGKKDKGNKKGKKDKDNKKDKNDSPSKRTKNHIIIFPYYMQKQGWALGLLELWFSRDVLQNCNILERAEIKVLSHLPGCSGKINPLVYEQIETLLQHKFNSFKDKHLVSKDNHEEIFLKYRPIEDLFLMPMCPLQEGYRGKREFPVNTTSEYDASMILMVWDSYVKDKGRVKYFIDKNGKGDVLETIFKDEKNKREEGLAGLLIKENKHGKELYLNNNESVSICGALDPTLPKDKITTNLNEAIKQIKLWNEQSKKGKIKNHVVIFPYHMTSGHWVLGTLKLISNESNSNWPASATITIFNPLPDWGERRISAIACEQVEKLLKDNFTDNKNLTLNLEDSKYGRQQNDLFSHGAISAENGKKFLDSTRLVGANPLAAAYPCGAEALRAHHIIDVNNDDFYEAQFFTNQERNLKPFKPQNYQELKKKFWEILESASLKGKLEEIIRKGGAKREQEVEVAIQIKNFIQTHENIHKLHPIPSLFDTTNWTFKEDHIHTLINIIADYNFYTRTLEDLRNNNPQTKVIDFGEIDLTEEQLQELVNVIKVNRVVGYIHWKEVSGEKVQENYKKLKERIEDRLVKNICAYNYHPSDYAHGLLANHAYEDYIQEGEEVNLDQLHKKIDAFREKPDYLQVNEINLGTNWKVVQVINDINTSGFYSCLYVNESKHQAVLAFKGSTYYLQDWMIEDINGIFAGNITTQHSFAYKATKFAAEYTKRRGFNLSITGHSLGGYLAELSVAYYYHDNPEASAGSVRGIVFDSPGTSDFLNILGILKFPVDDLPITTYLSAPNLANVCHAHPGREAYRIFPTLKGEGWQKKIEELLPWIAVKIQDVNKLCLALGGHKLNIMLSSFDADTGKPRVGEYVRVRQWPKIDTENLKHMRTYDIFSSSNKLKQLKKAIKTMGKFARNPFNISIAQYWTTLKCLDDDYTIKVPSPMGQESIGQEFIRKCIGHYEEDNDRRDRKYSLSLDNYRGVDWYFERLKTYTPSLDKLPTENVTRRVLQEILQGYELVSMFWRPHISLLELKQYVENLRDKMRRALDILGTGIIEGVIKGYLSNQHVSKRCPIRLEADKSVLDQGKMYVPMENKQRELSRILAKQGVCVLAGIGGVGKSTLAYHYAYEQKQKQKQTLCWIEAATLDKLVAGYENLYKQITDNASIEHDQIDVNYLKNLAHKVYDGLRNCNQSTLLVLDNAMDPSLIAACLVYRPPTNEEQLGIQVIITTRDQKSFKNYDQVSLEAFSPKEGKSYIKNRLKGSKLDEGDIEELIKTIGLVPIQLVTAVGYIDDNKDKIEFVDSVPQFKNVKGCINDLQSEIGNLRGVYLKLKTLDASLQSIMRYGAYLDPDLIPLPLVSRLLGITDDGKKLSKILGNLERLSLINKNLDRQGIQIHQEIQAACIGYKGWATNSKLREKVPAEEVLKVLSKLVPPDVKEEVPNETWRRQARLYAPSVNCFLQNAAEPIKNIIENSKNKSQEKQHALITLFLFLSNYKKYVACNYQHNIEYRSKILGIYQQIHQEKCHVDLAIALNNLGDAYQLSSNFEIAKAYYLQALNMRFKYLFQKEFTDLEWLLKNLSEVTNTNDLYIATYFNNLGTVTKDYDEALKYHTAALDMRKAYYKDDPNHPDIANSLNNIGCVKFNSGKYKDALVNHKKALKIRKAYYKANPNHPDIASSFSNKAFCKEKLGEYGDALFNYQNALKVLQNYYTDDPNHLNIARAFENVGKIHEALGNNEEALGAHQNAHTLFTAFHGNQSGHTDIQRVKENIDRLQSVQQNSDDSKKKA